MDDRDAALKEIVRQCIVEFDETGYASEFDTDFEKRVDGYFLKIKQLFPELIESKEV